MPSSPMAASAAVTGTTSAAVIQSSPSMKFTRLTNHNPPTTRSRALDPPRQKRHDAQFVRQRKNHRRNRERLQQEPRHDVIGMNVGDDAHDRDQDDGREQNRKRHGARFIRCRVQHPDRYGDGRCDDGNAAALRRRHLVRGAGIGAGQRVTLEQRTQER